MLLSIGIDFKVLNNELYVFIFHCVNTSFVVRVILISILCNFCTLYNNFNNFAHCTAISEKSITLTLGCLIFYLIPSSVIFLIFVRSKWYNILRSHVYLCWKWRKVL